MKLTVDDFGLEDYLGRELTCPCGREHIVSIDRIEIGSGAIEELPSILHSYGYESIFLVADSNTYSAAGERVEEILNSNGFNIERLIYRREGKLVPDERAIGEFLASYDKGIEVIITIGSGVLSDISKYMSYMLDTPCIMVATAPSMDGYASVGSAFILNGAKTSLESLPPKVIIGDTDILKASPIDMIFAGIGDMIGKYSSLRDWKLANIVTGEYHCMTVERMVEESLNRCIEDIEGFTRRDSRAVEHLMEGLILVGIAMSFIGNSRPASGSEHHMSHFWELISLMEDRDPIAHGIQVGIATVLTSRLAEELIDLDVDFEHALRGAGEIDEGVWEREIYRVYREAAPEIIKLNREPMEDMVSGRRDRVEKIEDSWPKIIKILRSYPSSEAIEELLLKAGKGQPTRPEDIGLDRDIVRDTILYAKEVRKRYTILQLLWDIGLLDRFSEI